MSSGSWVSRSSRRHPVQGCKTSSGVLRGRRHCRTWWHDERWHDMVCVAHESGRRPILARICGSRGKFGLKVVIDSACEARTTNHWFHLLQERPNQCVGHCPLGMIVSLQLKPTTGMCVPVWATAPLRRIDQLAVGSCSDQSVKGQSSTWTLMTSNLLCHSVLQGTWWKVWSVIFVRGCWTSHLKVVIPDRQFPLDVLTGTTHQSHMILASVVGGAGFIRC